MTESNQTEPQQPDPEPDQPDQPDQDAEPPGSGVEGPVHTEEPAEGP
jgi:hypothetical protein